jgi:hypothetical protein
MMRVQGLVIGSVVLALAGAARADAPAATAAAAAAPEQVAKAWLDPVLAGGAIAAPTKDQPLEIVTNSDAKSCKKLKGAARVTDAKGAKQIASCVVDAWRAVTKLEPANPENGEWKTGTAWQRLDAEDIESAAEGFPTRGQQKKALASAKGATVVRTTFTGEMRSLDVWLAIGADGKVRAVWMEVMEMN